MTDIKITSLNHFVYTDASRINLDPLFTKTHYAHYIKYKDAVNRKVLKEQTIVGFTCMERDRLFKLKDAPALNVGDIITYQDVGAYTMCLSPLFIQYYPDVYLLNDGQYQLIRKKWTVSEYLANE